MSNIFDLEKVKQLIEKERPVCAVLLDTNVIMNFPLYDNWKVTSGPTVFILPSGTNNELEYLKNKNIKNDPDSQKTPQKAIEAIKQLDGKYLCYIDK